ncbi:hypothetical protein CJ030_MR5G001741 [Morella rubra]|uniref:Malectin-like domain-containing protein n=1 Tax=Morella rubra TaxID=262757 RepID=A0A6A1VJT3_9ROSI|nr:hypothetical protein CJ030_MR5G001741 [Morella rubra]
MEMATHFALLLLVALSASSILKPSMAMFLSIDCGATYNETFPVNYINWTSDGEYVHTGESRVVDRNRSTDPVMNTLRVFPKLKKNCYTFPLRQGERVLVRASFYYGNYDGLDSPPTFELQFDGNYWATVNMSKAYLSNPLFGEAIYDVKGNSTSICVAQTLPNQIPFINAIEVRSLGSNMYSQVDSDHALIMKGRFSECVSLGGLVRYPYDEYDRTWITSSIFGGTCVRNEAASVDANTTEDIPPQIVLQMASLAQSTSYYIDLFPRVRDEVLPIYINLYFSEVALLNATERRSFQVYVNNKTYSDPIIPPYQSTYEAYITNVTAASINYLALVPTPDSTLPPLINAFEVYTVTELADGTYSKDVEGLLVLQKSFELLKNWTGDPCLPSPYAWEWVQCNTSTFTPRVIALDLSGFGLSGSLPDFGSMDALQTIDLSYNHLSGPVPDFMTNSFPNLKLLDLSYNQFTGNIPPIYGASNMSIFFNNNCPFGNPCPNTSVLPPPRPSSTTPPPPPPSRPSSGSLEYLSFIISGQQQPITSGSNKRAEKLPLFLGATIQISLLLLLRNFNHE